MSVKKSFKIIVLGDGGVGKTSLTIRFVSGAFRDIYKVTLGVDFFVKTVEIKENRYKLMIFDTGGQERFSKVRPLYYKSAKGALLVYDRTDPESFQNLDVWMKEIEKFSPSIPMVMVGNKSDLTDKITVPNELVGQFAENEGIPNFNSSAKLDNNIVAPFMKLVELIINDKKREPKPEKQKQITTESSQQTIDSEKEKQITSKESPLQKALNRKKTNLPQPIANNQSTPAMTTQLMSDLLQIKSLMIIEKKSGVPVLTINLSSKVDSYLASGMLTAISSFGKEIRGNAFDNSGKQFSQMGEEGSIFWLFDGEFSRFAFLLTKEPSNNFKTRAWSLVSKFEKEYRKKFENFNGLVKEFEKAQDLIEQELFIHYLYPFKIDGKKLTEQVEQDNLMKNVITNYLANFGEEKEIEVHDLIDRAFKEIKIYNYDEILKNIIDFIEREILMPQRKERIIQGESLP